MTTNGSDEYGRRLLLLAKQLERVHQVARYDTADEKQAAKLAFDLLDLADSCRVISDNHLRALNDSSLPPEALHAVLIDIGEELRHILWHIRNSEFYSYLGD